MLLQNVDPRLGASSGLAGPGNSTGLNSPQPLTGRSGASPHQTHLHAVTDARAAHSCHPLFGDFRNLFALINEGQRSGIQTKT